MTQRVYVTSSEPSTGKSTIAVGLVQALSRRGQRVGVFRPLVRSADEIDVMLATLLRHATAEATYAECVGVDYREFHDHPADATESVIERAAALESRCDWLVILGSDYTGTEAPTELAENGRLAADLGAVTVLVVNGRSHDGEPRSPQEIGAAAQVGLAELLEVHAEVASVIVNRCDPDRVSEAAEQVRGLVGGRPTWAIAEDPNLTAPLLSNLLQSVGARLLRGDERALGRPVYGTIIAAMSLESILPRLAENCLVVVPGDRSEILLGVIAADASQNYPSIAGLLVTAGSPVSPEIEAVISGLASTLPLASCDHDTYSTATRLAATRSMLAADSPEKYAIAEQLFELHVDADALLAALSAPRELPTTPARFEHALAERARARRMRIVLPEGDDDRVLRAAAIAAERGIAEPIVLGDEALIRARARELELSLDSVRIMSPTDPDLIDRFSDEYARLRAHKGVTRKSAAQTMTDVSYFGTMMVHLGLADGMVSGALHTTAQTIRPAFEIIKTRPETSIVSSVFLMALADRVLVYGDCAIILEPTPEQLADIAISAAATAEKFGIPARVAMLSYSTSDSGVGERVDAVRRATALLRERAPGLPVVGPIQYDAAIDPTVASVKLPGSEVAGHATVFVFPDLDAGNTTYKAVQRSASALAIGPVLQGLKKPVNDLSRGALVRDIVNTIAITAIQAQDQP